MIDPLSNDSNALFPTESKIVPTPIKDEPIAAVAQDPLPSTEKDPALSPAQDVGAEQAQDKPLAAKTTPWVDIPFSDILRTKPDVKEEIKPVEVTRIDNGDYGIKLDDNINIFKKINGKEWVTQVGAREAKVEELTKGLEESLKTPGQKVPAIRDGEVVMVPASANGVLTNAGLHMFNKSIELIAQAQASPNGGYNRNPFTGKTEPQFGSRDITPYDAQKEKDQKDKLELESGRKDNPYKLANDEVFDYGHISSVLDTYISQNELELKDINPESLTPERFLEIRNRVGSSSATKGPTELTKQIDSNAEPILDKSSYETFKRALGQYNAEKSLGDKLVGVHDGLPIVNYEKITDLNKFEEEFSQLKLPAATKSTYLATFKKNFESDAAKILNEQFQGSFIKPGFSNVIGSGDETIQKWAEGTTSAYDLLKSDPFAFNNSPLLFTVFKRTSKATAQALYNTGVGAGTLGLLALSTVYGAVDEGAGDYVSDLAMSFAEGGSALNDSLNLNAKYDGGINKIGKIGSYEITDQAIYNLAGQIIETYVTGGISLGAKALLKGGEAVVTSAIKGTVREALQIGSKQAAKKIAEKGITSSIGKQSVNFTEAAKSLWTNSKKVGQAESILATGLQGSFGSAGSALSQSYGEGINKGLTEEEAFNAAIGQATANGLATFTATTVMGMVAPGIERVLSHPEEGLSILQAVKNTLNARSSLPKITDALKDLGVNGSRKAIAKGVAESLRGMASSQGVGGFFAKVALNSTSEAVEEAVDTALAVTIDAHLNQSEEAKAKLGSKGFLFEVLGAGVLGALGAGATSGVFVTTSDTNKKMAERAKQAINDKTLERIGSVGDNLDVTVNIAGKDSSSPRTYQQIGEILKTGTVAQQVDAIANFGKNISLAVSTGSPSTSTPAGLNNLKETLSGMTSPTKGSGVVAKNEVSSGIVESKDFDPIRSELSKKGLSSFTVLGSGKTSAVLESGGKAVRIQKGSMTEFPKIDGMVKVESTDKVGDLSYAITEKVDSSDITEEEIASVKDSLAKQGYELSDSGVKNIGRTADGKLVVTSANAIKKTNPEEDTGQPSAKTIKEFSITNDDLSEVTVSAPVDSEKELAAYAYEQAHGVKTSGGVIAPVTQKTTIQAMVNKRVTEIPVTSYTIDGKTADLHSVTIDGRTFFASKSKLDALIRDKYGATSIAGVNKISSKNEYKDAILSEQGAPEAGNPPEQKPDKKPKTEEGGSNNPPDANKPEAKPEEDAQPFESVDNGPIKGINKLNKQQKTIIQKFKGLFTKLRTDVIIVSDYNDMNAQLDAIGYSKELRKVVGNYSAFFVVVNGRNLIFFNANHKDNLNLSEFAATIKHEIFHAIEDKFRATKKGESLFNSIDQDSIVTDPEIVEYMKEEYSSEFGNYVTSVKFSELMRAVIAGKVHKKTFGQPAFVKYLNEFLKFASKFIKGNKPLEAYSSELEAYYRDSIKEFNTAYGIEAAQSPAFKQWINSVLDSVTSPLKAVKKRRSKMTDAGASPEQIVEIVDRIKSDIAHSVNEAASKSEPLNAIDIIDGIVDILNNEFIGLNQVLDVESKKAILNKVISEWSNAATKSEINDIIKGAIAKVSVNRSTILFSAPYEKEAIDTIAERAKMNGWTGVSRFIRGDKVTDDVASKRVSKTAVNDANVAPYTDAYLNIPIDLATNTHEDLGLNPGDVIETTDENGDVTGTLIYSHSIEVSDSLSKFVQHRFIKVGLNSDGTASPFGKILKARYAKEFYETIIDSGLADKMFATDKTGATVITSPESLVKTIFGTLVSKDFNGNPIVKAGDKTLAFGDLFEFQQQDDRKSTSPFYFQNGKIYVNTAKLTKLFGFVNGEMIDSQSKRESVAMMASSIVRAALEEEMLHFATVNTFSKDELVSFFDGMQKNDMFNNLVEQIKLMQGITNDVNNLTDDERVIIAVEAMSFIHQKASEGATYADQYEELIAVRFGKNASLDSAKAYGQRFRYMLGARSITSFMSPKMQEMNERLNARRVKMGATRRATNMSDLFSSYSNELYQGSRANMDKAINSAFLGNAYEVNDLRELLAGDLNIPVKDVLSIDFTEGTVSLNPAFEQYYESVYGKESLDALNSYFSQLNENAAVKSLADTVRNSRSRMDAARSTLDYVSGADSAIEMALNGNFDELTAYLEQPENKSAKFSFAPVIQVLNGIVYDTNITKARDRDNARLETIYNTSKQNITEENQSSVARANTVIANLLSEFHEREETLSDQEFIDFIRQDQYSQFTDNEFATKLQALARQKGEAFTPAETVIRYNIEQKSKRDNLLSILSERNVPTETGVVSPNYYSYAETVRDYNDLVLNYAELLLNKNLNKVEDFGRSFTPIASLIPNPSNTLTFNVNLFGYNNESADVAIANRTNSRKEKNDKTDSEWKATTAWQQSYVGRYTSNDRAQNPEKVSNIESNAALLGEEHYNDYSIARINGEKPMYSGMSVSYSAYYSTMGFVPLVSKERIVDGYSEPEDLDTYLLKFKVSDNLIQYKKGETHPTIRGIDADKVLKASSDPEQLMRLATLVTNELFDSSKIDVWFSSLQKLIGYNRNTGEVNIVQSLNGKETFASKFADQLIYRMFDGKLTTGIGAGESIINSNSSNKTLFEKINDLRSLYEFTHPMKLRDSPKIRPDEIVRILADLNVFLEQVDALNQDIGLARKTYSRFKSKYLSSTIMGDVRLIQQQGTEGIRANQELIKIIQDSYYDIQGMDDIAWQMDYLNKNGPVGFQGITAIQMLDAFSKIPSSATNEYFITDPISGAYTVETYVKTDKGYEKQTINVKGKGAYRAALLQKYYALDEMYRQLGMGSPRGRDADGKMTYALDNLIFNTVGRPADRPSEFDEEFNEDITPLNRGQETASSMPSNLDMTEEQLNNQRRIDLISESMRVKSWVTQAALVVFQEFSPVLELQYDSSINTDKAKRFFKLFADSQAMLGEEQDGDASANARNASIARIKLAQMIKDQMLFLANKYKNSDGTIDSAFSDIAEKADSYKHPMELLLDVMEVVGSKERAFINELQQSSGQLGTMVASQLEQVVAKNIQGYSSGVTSPQNVDSSLQILDSIKEDMDKGQLVAGTLFNARTFNFKESSGLIDNSLFMKSPLFSMLLQAMPNLIVYQPNEAYKGKAKLVSNDIEFAQLPNGDSVLFIRNPQGVNSSKQAEILEKLLISKIDQERKLSGSQPETLAAINNIATKKERKLSLSQSETMAAINNIATKIREQINHAFTTTPDRIANMCNRAETVLRANSNIPPDVVTALIDKYRAALNIEAAEKLSVLSAISNRGKYIEDNFGVDGDNAKSFFDNLLYSNEDIGEVSYHSNIALVVEMFTNPDAYAILSAIKSPNVELTTISVDPRYGSLLSKALEVFSTKEVQSSMVFDIALEQGAASEFGDDGDPYSSPETIDFRSPDFIISAIESAFEERFINGESETSKGKQSRIKKSVAFIDSAPSALVKSIVDKFLILDEVKSDYSESGVTYDQVSKGIGILEDFAPRPNFFYEFAATELFNALTPAQDFNNYSYSSISLFDPSYPVDKIGPANSYELIKGSAGKISSKKNFPVLMDSVGAGKSSSYGNITNFFYGKSPLTKIFENRRKSLFVTSLLSNTPAANNIISGYFEQALKGNNSFSKSINVLESKGLLTSLMDGLSLLVGNDLVNEAQQNVINIERAKKKNINDANNRIVEIDGQIADYQKQGVDFIRQILLEGSKLDLGESAVAIASLSDKLANIVWSTKTKSDTSSSAISQELSSGVAAKHIAAYKTSLAQIETIDGNIKELLRGEYLAANIDAGNRVYADFIRQHNQHVQNAQVFLAAYSKEVAKVIANNLINGAHLDSSGLDSLVQFVDRNLISGLNVYNIPFTELTLDNISATSNSLNRFLVNPRSKRSKSTAASNVNTYPKISELVAMFNADVSLRSQIEQETTSILTSPDVSEATKEMLNRLNKKELSVAMKKIIKDFSDISSNDATKEMFSRLKKRGLSAAIKKIIKDFSNVSSKEDAVKLIEAQLFNNPSIVKSLTSELFNSDLRIALEAIAETDANEGAASETPSGIGAGNIAIAIDNLMDEKRALVANLDRMDGDTTNTKTNVFQFKKKFGFDENTTNTRIDNNLSPTLEVRVNATLDTSNPKNDPDLQESIGKAKLKIATINEAGRLFIEREGESMYRAMFEEVDLFGAGYDLKEDITKIIEIARLRKNLKASSEFQYDVAAKAAFDTELMNANGKATQMFGLSVREMEDLKVSPVVVTTNEDGTQEMSIPSIARAASEKARLRGLALFIEDEFSKSVFMPTTTKLEESPNKSYLVYNSSARNELEKHKRRTNAEWKTDDKLKDIIFRAALNPSNGGAGGLKTQSHRAITVDGSKEITPALAAETGLPKTTKINDLIKIAKQKFATTFLKSSINVEISPFALGIGINGAVPRIRAMKATDYSDAFDDIYDYASNANNASILQTSGMSQLTKEKSKYSEAEIKQIVDSAYSIAIKQNPFLDPESKTGQAISFNQSQLVDSINMLNSIEINKPANVNNFTVPIEAAVKSIGSLIKVDELIAGSTTSKPYNTNNAVLALDLSQNYAMLYSILYGSETLNRLIVGANNIKPSGSGRYNALKSTQEWFSHENALNRSRFAKNYGSYEEALNLIGLLDHGVDGNSGRNRYEAEYQAFQDRVGTASKDLNNHYVNGARAMLIASLKGIALANQKDNGSDQDLAMKLWKWSYSFQEGMRDHKRIKDNKEKAYKTANTFYKIEIKFSRSANKQKREGAGIQEINKLIKQDVNAITTILNINSLSKDQVNTLIDGLIGKLESGVSTDELQAINKYSNSLLNEFSDIADAHRMTQTFASKDARTSVTDKQMTLPTEVSEVLSENYSVVPLRFGHVRNPLNMSTEGFTQDAIDIDEFVSMEGSSMNYRGRNRRKQVADNENDVLRPLDLNPFTVPDQIANDSMYRIYVSPTYKVIKKLLGEVSRNGKDQLVSKNGFLHGIAQAKNPNINISDQYPYVAAYVMNTINKTIRNDVPQDIDDNILNDALKLGNVIVAVKGLSSVWQPFTQGIVPAVSKLLSVISTNKLGMTDKDVKILAEAYKYAFIGYLDKDSDIARFIKENSIMSYKWKASGTDIRETQIALAKYYGESKLKYGARYVASKLRNIGEGTLDVLIGGPERAMVQSIFAFELFSELKQTMGQDAPKTLKEMFAMDPSSISTLAKTKADIMVTDFMGLGDKSKKAQIYNIRGAGTVGTMVANSLTRYGNHTATVSANTASFVNLLYNKHRGTPGFDDDRFTNEAVENLIGTTIQNSLFLLARITVGLPIALWITSAITELFDEDIPDEDKLDDISQRAIDWYRKYTMVDEDGWRPLIWIKEQVFPQYSVLTSDNIDATAGERYASLVGQVGKELFQENIGNIIPSVSYGALRGMLPVRSVEALSASLIYDTGKKFVLGEENSRTYGQLARASKNQNRIFENMFAAPFAPIEATANMKNLLLNYVAPKDGKEGIDFAEFSYGLLNATAGTREGRRNVPKRHAELGGWGY